MRRPSLNPLCLFLSALILGAATPTASASSAARAPTPPATPSPATAAPPPPAPPPSDADSGAPGHADLDPTNDFTVAPPDVIPDCEARLDAAGIRWKPATLATRRAKEGHECGAPQVVVYRGPAGGVRWSSPPLVTCGMALALANFETVLQEEALKYFKKRVVRIEHLGTYACREMARYDWVSEHSYANAIDLRAFQLSDGRIVSVEKYFGHPPAEPKTNEGRFLRALANRLYDDGVFSTVVTELFDKLHWNHFHVDLARYRVDGSR